MTFRTQLSIFIGIILLLVGIAFVLLFPFSVFDCKDSTSPYGKFEPCYSPQYEIKEQASLVPIAGAILIGHGLFRLCKLNL
jgi:hypothetical protein